MTIDEAIKHAEEVAEKKERDLKVYESINEDRPLFKEEENECQKCAEEHRQLAEWLKELKQLREQTRWIPVSERLPDNNVRVLCCGTSKSISGGYTRFVGCCNNGFWFVQTNAETVSFPGQYEVTAWMPLPEPYKKSED